MKKNTNIKLWQKIILTIAVVIMIFQVSYPSIVFADDDDGTYGVVFGSIQSATVGLGDGLMYLANLCVGGSRPVFFFDHDLGKIIWSTIAGVAEIAGGVLLFIFVSRTAATHYFCTIVAVDVAVTVGAWAGWFRKTR